MNDDQNENGWNGTSNNYVPYDSYTQNQAGVGFYDSPSSAYQKVLNHQYDEQQRQQKQQEEYNRSWQATNTGGNTGTSGNYYAPSGSYSRTPSKPFSFQSFFQGIWDGIASLFHFVFIFIPLVFLYYIPIKHFFKTVMTVVFLALAYMTVSGVGNKIILDYQLGLKPKNMTFKPIEYYVSNNKYVNQYRKLDAEGIYRMHKIGMSKLSSNQLIALGAVMKERLLNNPEYFDSIKETFGGVSFATVACNYSRNYYSDLLYTSKKIKHRDELVLESGNFYFFEKCLTEYSKPASSFVDNYPYLENPAYKVDYDRITKDLIFQITHHYKYVAYAFCLIAFLILSVTIIKSYRYDKEKRQARILAKKAEKLKLSEKNE
ncbi:MAG: hypothetical protein WC009_02090 [Methylotenera sp.]